MDEEIAMKTTRVNLLKKTASTHVCCGCLGEFNDSAEVELLAHR
jgi:hypothetical protein